MDSRDITVWLDQRWYAALTHHLKDETVEDKLDGYLDELINQLPKQVRERISREIWEEDQLARQECEVSRVLAGFHVRENGQEEWFQVDNRTAGRVELLDAARALRRYLRGEPGADVDSFAKIFRHRESIIAEEFDQLVELRMENTGKVSGVFELDFDRREFSALHIMDGWKTWAMSDVSTAAYHAFRKDRLSPEQRLNRLLDKLEGLEIALAGSSMTEGLTM